MAGTRVEITINAPRDLVFEVFADLGKAADRIAGIQAIELLDDDEIGVGSRWRETRIMHGREESQDMEITAFSPPNSYVAEADAHGTHYRSSYQFDEHEAGTRVVMEFSGSPRTLLARLLSPLGFLMMSSVKAMLLADMEDLKVFCENAVGNAPPE